MTIAWDFIARGTKVPEGWRIARVGELVVLSNGYPFSSELFRPIGQVPLVRIRDLLSEEFETFVDSPIPKQAQIRDGDVLIGMDGDFNLVLWRRGPAALNQRVCLLRPRPGVDIRFVAYALPQALRIVSDLTFSTTVKHLSSGDILSQIISLPPLAEQRRIADFLDAETARLDQIIHVRHRQLSLLSERYLNAISSRAVPGIASQDFDGGVWSWLPAALPTVRLGYLARVQAGVTVDSSRRAGPDSVERPYLRVANVQGESVDLSEIKTIIVPRVVAESSTLRAGDVVMTEANGNPDNLGRGAVWDGSVPEMIHQNHIFAIRVDPRKLLPSYLSILLASIHGRRYFRFTSSQVGIATTSSSKVLAMPVPVMDMGEQAKVVMDCSSIRETCDKTRAAISQQTELLRERRQALITAAVTGQFDVTTARGVDVS